MKTPLLPLWIQTLWQATTITFLLVAILSGGILFTGYLDPIPRQMPPVGNSTTLTLSPHEQTTTWTPHTLPNHIQPTHLRLTINHLAGNQDAWSGLLLGDPHHYLAILITPTKNLTIFTHTDTETTLYVPSRPYPHIQAGFASNEWHIVRQADTITLWLNREWVWSGTLPALNEQIGIYTQTYQTKSTFTFAVSQNS